MDDPRRHYGACSDEEHAPCAHEHLSARDLSTPIIVCHRTSLFEVNELTDALHENIVTETPSHRHRIER